ncbi:MAG: SDR family oxidoreductase [Alphaproteobacteria bacterium]
MFRTDLLAGKRILVTGGGTGLGRSMARRFLGLGASVAICGRRADVLRRTADELGAETGGPIGTHPCDLRDPAAVDDLADTLFAGGGLDILINNAAGNFAAPTESLSYRALDAVLAPTLHGAAYITLACGRRWLAAEKQAQVLSILTTYAFTGSAYVVPSAMAKGALLAMTRSLAVEWGGRGVRFNAIAPGPFPTEGAWERLVPKLEGGPDLARMFETQNPLGRAGKHDELANLAAFMLADEMAYLNGEVVTLDGGEWLKGAGQFNFLSCLSADDWRRAREAAKKDAD